MIFQFSKGDRIKKKSDGRLGTIRRPDLVVEGGIETRFYEVDFDDEQREFVAESDLIAA
jgi:hypothetical protein